MALLVFSSGCSTKKDAFLNRSYHLVSTKYNILYNGNLALNDGLEEMNANYQDNFWEQLPIEPLKVDQLALPGMVADQDASPGDFERAEEKAVKAVQKHSMVIVRQERNRQIDDAYLLLGKARYYSKRFVPALEAFNFLLMNYPGSDLFHEARIWQAKTQIRLQNEEQAIANLNDLLNRSKVESHIGEMAYTALAMGHVALDEKEKAREQLESATSTDHDKTQTARNLFILGQMFRESGEIEKSTETFRKLIELKRAPYKYVIRARIEVARNVTDKLDALEVREELLGLVKDRDNRPFLDELYYQLGVIAQESDKELAREYYEKSLGAGTGNNLQRELTYEALGNLHFDKAAFSTAGAYYDSVIRISTQENSKRLRRLVRRRNNLNEVIYYEGIARRHDSILRLVSMNESDREEFFTAHIDSLRALEEKTAIRESTGSGFLGLRRNTGVQGGKWYFYNTQTMGFGVQEFRRTWGTRPLEDNWRLSDKTQIDLGDSRTVTDQANAVLQGDRFDLETYMESVPTDTGVIDSLKTDRDIAYFRLGVIYKEQFGESALAVDRLEGLLRFSPSADLILPAKYHLFRLYELRGSDKADSFRNDIVENYADSDYARFILNPNQAVESADANLPEKEYAEAFYAYKAEQYNSVIARATEASGKYEGHAIVAKFELLKAYALGKKEGKDAFVKALEFVALNFPNTEEGKKAMEVKENLIKD
jgi:tetratricopeptide (TPR) repeat protein